MYLVQWIAQENITKSLIAILCYSWHNQSIKNITKFIFTHFIYLVQSIYQENVTNILTYNLFTWYKQSIKKILLELFISVLLFISVVQSIIIKKKILKFLFIYFTYLEQSIEKILLLFSFSNSQAWSDEYY